MTTLRERAIEQAKNTTPRESVDEENKRIDEILKEMASAVKTSGVVGDRTVSIAVRELLKLDINGETIKALEGLEPDDVLYFLIPPMIKDNEIEATSNKNNL